MGDALSRQAEIVAALQEVSAGLTAMRDRLDNARIPDAALGKLFEARAVRDAYHARLPLIEHDLDQASAVVGHFVAQSAASTDSLPGSTAPESTGSEPFGGRTGSGAS
jgi:hypothetical protein